MTYVKRLIVFSTTLFVWTVSLAYSGPLTLSLEPAQKNGQPNDVLTFSGTISNTSPVDQFLNGSVSTAPASDFTVDSLPFVIGAPQVSASGTSFSGDLFTVYIDSQALPGLYEGSFAIEGGTQSDAFDTIASSTFSIEVENVTSVPEPSTEFLMISGCVGLLYKGRLSGYLHTTYNDMRKCVRHGG